MTTRRRSSRLCSAEDKANVTSRWPPKENMARNLQKLGIVAETTGRSRNQRFVYLEYLRIIEEGAAG